MIVSLGYLYFTVSFTPTTAWLLYKIARIPMVIVKLFKLNIFYGIFIVLYYVLVSI